MGTHRAFTVDAWDRATLAAALRGQVVVTERDHEGNLLAVTGVQTPGVLDDLYAAATKAPLGVTFAGRRPTLCPAARPVDGGLRPGDRVRHRRQ